MRILFLLIILTFTSLHSWSQTITTGQADQICGTEERHAIRMEKDPAYKSRFLRQKAIFDSIKVAPVSLNRHLTSVMTIPVVVHVIHLGEPIGSQSNISDAQIYGAIDGLNERFENVNEQGINIEINFCLATRDPNGCPTSGINRVDGSVIPRYREEGISWHDECGVQEWLIKDLSKWPTWDYYNVWVVHDICGNIAGYAYYPNGDEYDGTVIETASMRYESGTLTHELGHGLNIRHTFSGEDDDECPLNDDCMEDGDEICDTPPHRRGDCASHINPCSTEGNWVNSLNNWMSYCHPSGDIGLFTEGQRTRMWDAMSVEPRSALLLSEGCANAEAMKFTSDAGLMCPYETRVLTAQPAGGYFQIASGTGYIQDSILTPTSGPEVILEYIIEQPGCTSSVFQEIPVRLVPNALLRSAEDTLCVGQTSTLQGFPSGGTFSIISGPGMLDSTNTLISQGEGVISLAYEKMFSGCMLRDSHVVASFDYPVAEIEPLSESILTAVPDSGSFQWLRCDEDYELMPGDTNALLQVTSSGSYALVSTRGLCSDTSDCVEVILTSIENEKEIAVLKVYPNPVKDVFYLDGYQQDEVEVTLSDMRGVEMKSIVHQQGNGLKIDMSSFASGVYIVRVYVKGVGFLVERVVKV